MNNKSIINKNWLEHMHSYKYVSGLSESPNQKRASFVVTQVNSEENSYEQSLWELSSNGIKQLTDYSQPRAYIWEDDNNIIFADNFSDKKGNERILPETSYKRLNLDGGEALPAFTVPLKVSVIYPIAKDEYLFLSEVEQEEIDLLSGNEKERENYYKSISEKSWRRVYERIPFYLNGNGFFEEKSNRLMYFNSKTSEVKALSPKSHNINAIYLNKDKSKAYFTGSKVSTKLHFTDGLWELDLSTLRIKLLTLDSKLNISHIYPVDGKLILIASDMRRIGINQNCNFWEWNFEERKSIKLDNTELDLGNSVGNDANYGPQKYVANRADHMQLVRTIGTKSVLDQFDSKLNKVEIVNKEGSLCSFAKLNGTNYVIGFYDMKLAEIYKVISNSELEQVSFFNDALYEDFPVQFPETLEFKSSSDETILDGFVITPPEFDFTSPDSYPAILAIHGGPKTAYGAIYNHEMQTWANAGYVVFYCNPHGSSGKGDIFSDIRGKYGDIDFADILDFTEAVLKNYPAIDKNRLGVTGGSYGGFMTNWIITHTDMFKAAATQRSIYNWLSFYGTSDIGYYFATDQNKTKIDDHDFIETLWDHSPMKYIDNAKTPTLIIHSDEDYRCPVEQAYQLHVALVDREVDSKLVLFHGENHELSRSGKPLAREERLEQITSWMNKYLKDQNNSSDEMDACAIGFC